VDSVLSFWKFQLFWNCFGNFFSCFCVLVKCPFYGFLKGTGAYSFSNGIIGDIIFLEDVVDHLKKEEDILSHEWLGGSPVT